MISDSGLPIPTVPSDPPAGSPAPNRGEPLVPARRAVFLTRCAAPILFLVRRPGRTAAFVGLTALIVLGAWMVGVHLWGQYRLQAARAAVEHYHNRIAREHLEAYLRVWLRDPAALLLAARTARRVGMYEEAQSFLDRCEAVSGKDDEGLILERVLLQAQRGRTDEVREYCLAGVRENHPSAPLILEAQAAGLMRDYRIGEAQDCLETWLKLQPDNCQALLLQGILYDLQGLTSEAATHYRRVTELDPDNDDARMRLTAILLQTHEPMEALPHLERLRKALPNDPRILARIGKCRLEMGQTEQATKIVDDALARYPHSADLLAVRGNLALEDGQLEQAEPWLREAVARDPADAGLRYHLFRCLSALGKAAEADIVQKQLNELEEDLKENDEFLHGKMQQFPHDPALRVKAGMIALRVGDDEEGLRWLESALELDPGYAPAHEALATYYQRNGDPGRAASYRAKAGN